MLEGIKLQHYKVKLVMGIETPKTGFQLRCFIGVVKLYQYLCHKSLHTLDPFSKISVKNTL